MDEVKRAARISAVDEGSPAWRAGLRAGMELAAICGHPLRDYIDWLWYTDTNEVEIESVYGKAMMLRREAGEPWGVDFDGVVFDGIKTCCNTCSFCFMSMLPQSMRPSLYVHDDDYRLSFLQGNFVTLTNMTDEDIRRVIELRLSPLQVSLHAVTPEVRECLMGAHHARGIEVLELLLEAGIEVQVQIVVVAGVNDGEELDKTLAWIEPRTGIRSVGLVPCGYTRYADQEGIISAEKALKLLDILTIFQKRARATTGMTRFMASDEWYSLAYPGALLAKLPPAEAYDGYPQIEDGVGLLRSFIDEWRELSGTVLPRVFAQRTVIATGAAFAPVLQELMEESFGAFAKSDPGEPGTGIEVRAIENRFFGGNVEVAGLITARDIIEQLGDISLAHPQSSSLPRVVISDVMLNDDGLFLDDLRPDDVAGVLNLQVDVVSCTAKALVEYLQNLP